MEVVDPYATDVDDGNNVAIAHLKNGKKFVDTYIWQHDDQPLPGNDELVIYEMHVSDFSSDDPQVRGKFNHVSETEDEKAEKAKVVTVSSRVFYPQAAI